MASIGEPRAFLGGGVGNDGGVLGGGDGNEGGGAQGAGPRPPQLRGVDGAECVDAADGGADSRSGGKISCLLARAPGLSLELTTSSVAVAR